jgi:hypothetical protein
MDVKAIAYCIRDKYMKPYVDEYVKNKKHIKRKFSKELIEALTQIAKCIQSNNSNSFMFGTNDNQMKGKKL